MNIKALRLGLMGNNCYLVWDNNKNAVAIDPGFDFPTIKKNIEKLELRLDKIILTHGHFDHMGAAALLSEHFNAGVFIHKDEEKVMDNNQFKVTIKKPEKITYIDECGISCGSLLFKVIHTPGHTEGGICLYIDNCLFTGDTIFRQFIGRCDLFTGDINKITDSIINKIFKLPDDTVIYPGHDEPTTIGEEKNQNEVYRWL